MSVSGHCNYGWIVNDMSRKNKDAVTGEKGSGTVLAYKASQQELEYTLDTCWASWTKRASPKTL